MSSLTELREKVESSSGPDRELDAAIWALAEGWTLTYTESNVILADKPGEVPRVIGWIDPGEVSRNARINRDDIPAVTASIDAALALVERKLTGCVWTIECDACWLRILTADDVAEFQGYYTARGGKCTALAVCLALLRALESQEQAGG